MEIPCRVNGQRISVNLDYPYIIAGTQDFIRFVFDLPDEWKVLMPFVQFVQDDTGYNVYLDEEDWGCYFPAEIGAGTCYMVLYGSDGTVKATSCDRALKVIDNHMLVDGESTDISQSLYDQLVEMILSISSITNAQINSLF